MNELTPEKIQKLTLKPKRLAGNDACLNCGTVLKGPYCYYCGQPDKRFMRFFPALLRDMMEDFLDFDSRFSRTMKPLLFKPGKLTRDFVAGRRFRYTPPLRLYLFSSIILFLLASIISNFAISGSLIDVQPDGRGGVNVQIGAEDDRPVAAPAPAEAASETGTDDSPAADPDIPWYEQDNRDLVFFGDQPWHPESNPLHIPLLPKRFNTWLNEELKRSDEKGKMIAEDPKLIINEIFDVLPQTMFVLLPVFALLMKLFYLFSRRYYMEHLIYALHGHSFVYVCFIGIIFLESLQDTLVARGVSWVPTISGILAILLLLWIPVYFFIALKRVYQQGWFMTGIKFIGISLSYIALLGLVTSIVAAVSFLRV